MKLILILCTALIGCLLQADAQQQSQATCNALNATITNAMDGDDRGTCTVDTECLVISCMGSAAGDFIITFFPCEDPIVVNFRFYGLPRNITQNATETTRIPIGLASAFNVFVDPLPEGTGIAFGVEQMSIIVTQELFDTTDIPLQCQPVTTLPPETAAPETTSEATTQKATTLGMNQSPTASCPSLSAITRLTIAAAMFGTLLLL